MILFSNHTIIHGAGRPACHLHDEREEEYGASIVYLMPTSYTEALLAIHESIINHIIRALMFSLLAAVVSHFLLLLCTNDDNYIGKILHF